MNLTGIISISGKPGLYKVVAQGKNNIIVESLEDKKRVPAYSSDRISALEDISIYTYDEDVSLKVILKSIFEKEQGKPCVSHKEDKTKLEKYLLEVLPNYDQERVYASDVKKIFQWYNLLHKAGELKVEEVEEEKAEKVSKTKAKKEVSGDDLSTTQVVEKVATKEKKAPAKATKKVATKVVTKSAPKSAAPKKVTAIKTGAGRGK